MAPWLTGAIRKFTPEYTGGGRAGVAAVAKHHGTDVRVQRSQGPRHSHPMSSIPAGRFGYVIEAVCDAVSLRLKKMTLGEVNMPVVRLTH